MNETLFRISSNSLLLNIEFIAAVWTSPQKERAASCRSVFWAFEHSHTVDIGLNFDQTAWVLCLRSQRVENDEHDRALYEYVHHDCSVQHDISGSGYVRCWRYPRRTEPGHTYTRFHRSFDFALTTLAVRVLKKSA